MPKPSPRRTRSPRSRTRRALAAPPTARTADRYDFYQRSVQNVEVEIDFVDRVFTRLRGRRASTLREDFCGTANTACEWVRRRQTNRAIGVDLDPEPLAWGTTHNLSKLTPEQRRRLRLVRGNVLTPPRPGSDRKSGRAGGGVDIVLAMNFSYWVFHTRSAMLAYFRAVRRSLGRDGVFFLDFYGGSEALQEISETTWYGGPRLGFAYIWEQERYNPITGRLRCHISFKFRDGTRKRRAFTYDWRLWTLPELREILAEAGFSRTTVYCEGDDGKGGGNGVFKPTESAPADRSFVAYVVAVP